MQHTLDIEAQHHDHSARPERHIMVKGCNTWWIDDGQHSVNAGGEWAGAAGGARTARADEMMCGSVVAGKGRRGEYPTG